MNQSACTIIENTLHLIKIKLNDDNKPVLFALLSYNFFI